MVRERGEVGSKGKGGRKKEIEGGGDRKRDTPIPPPKKYQPNQIKTTYMHTQFKQDVILSPNATNFQC